MARDLADLLEPGERLLWSGSPERWAPPRLVTPALFWVGFVSVVAALVSPVVTPARGVPGGDLGASVIVFLGIFGSGTTLLVVSYLAQLARWRQIAYGVTDRRVLALEIDGGTTKLERRDQLTTRISSRRLVVEDRHGQEIRFEGIADPDELAAARAAIQDPQGPPA